MNVNLPESELLQRLNRYQRVDREMVEKYQMSFAEFQEHNPIMQPEHTFEVESDFWDWEMAQDGIEMVQTMLDELQEPRSEFAIAHS